MPNIGLGASTAALGGSIIQFWRAWRAVRICPDNIEAPTADLSINPLTIAISLAIFYIARSAVAANGHDIAISVIATVISAVIMFASGFVVILVAPGPDSIEKSRKWGLFFVMTWLVALLFLIICNAIPFWMGLTGGLTDLLIDHLFGPGNLSPDVNDLLSSAFFAACANVLMQIKSWIMDKTFRPWTFCAQVACGFAFVVNIALFQGFIYGHLSG